MTQQPPVTPTVVHYNITAPTSTKENLEAILERVGYSLEFFDWHLKNKDPRLTSATQNEIQALWDSEAKRRKAIGHPKQFYGTPFRLQILYSAMRNFRKFAEGKSYKTAEPIHPASWQETHGFGGGCGSVRFVDEPQILKFPYIGLIKLTEPSDTLFDLVGWDKLGEGIKYVFTKHEDSRFEAHFQIDNELVQSYVNPELRDFDLGAFKPVEGPMP